MRIGLVSDTHGLFEPALRPLFGGCAAILHAGDVVKAAVLRELEAIAPVTAVRGNNDDAPPLASLPEPPSAIGSNLRAVPTPPKQLSCAQQATEWAPLIRVGTIPGWACCSTSKFRRWMRLRKHGAISC